MDIFLPYIFSIGAIVIMMSLWVIVQRIWSHTFADLHQEEDALAGRKSCGNCGCGTTCSKKEIKEIVTEND